MVAISQSVWHFMKEVNMLQPNQKITALYCRLSRDDNLEGDSNSIQNHAAVAVGTLTSQFWLGSISPLKMIFSASKAGCS